MKRRPAAITLILFALAGLALLYFLRPIGLIHGPLMFLYMYPLLWMIPAAVGILAALFGLPKAENAIWFGFVGWVAGFTLTAVLILPAFIIPQTKKAIYNHYKFNETVELPVSGNSRILPKTVADNMASGGYDNSRFSLDEGHIVLNADGELQWTYGQIPGNPINKLKRPTAGILTQSAQTTARDETVGDVEFEVSPGRYFNKSVNWKAYKENFFSHVAETVFVEDQDGNPFIVAPYIKYEGTFIKVPVLGGVYLIDPDGNLKDLSPEQAAKNTVVASSGRMFPEKLTRQIHDSYQYKGGIMNKMFTHDDQIQLTDDGSGNKQPYLMDFKDGAKWVSTAKPYGKAGATSAIFFTDTITGDTEVWRAGESSLTGPQRAIQTVEALSIPGVVFAKGEDAEGKFQAIEPRPLIHDGRLQFVVSVIPNSNNSVTKTVVVDAATNKVSALFNHDTDPDADRDLTMYMQGENTGEFQGEDTSGEEAGEEAETGSFENQKQLIEQLIRENEKQRQLLDELKRQVEG